MGLLGGDAVHLHSWGSIFVQDVLVPLRKKPFGPRAHILVLRASMFGVALFAFLFGCLFHQTEYIQMWWSITAALYIGGAGAAIIGGLYWKKGTTAGAWTAMLTGSVLAGGGILLRQYYGDSFPLNGQQISFFASLLAIFLYVTVSLATCREDYNMDRMLHRGKYAVPVPGAASEAPLRKITWGRLIGLDENFTRGDTWIAGSLFAWNMLWFVVFVIGCVWNLIAPWSIEGWSLFWHIAAVGLPVLIAVVTGIWFTWGGLKDIRDLFRRLHQEKINHLDDGTVVGHQNLDDVSRQQKFDSSPVVISR
jgi:SSS family solute:Na+ symporter